MTNTNNAAPRTGDQQKQYTQDYQQQLAKLGPAVEGAKGRRGQIARDKLEADHLLYEETKDENGDFNDDNFSGGDDDGDDNPDDQNVGPHGEVYPDSSSGEEIIEDENGNLFPKRIYMPRCKLQAYKQADGKNLQYKRNNPQKFTKGTDPRRMDLMTFMVDDTISAPIFIPMNFNDAKLTNVVIEAGIQQPEIPLSEHIKKENFYKFFQAFNLAIQADPALIKTEI